MKKAPDPRVAQIGATIKAERLRKRREFKDKFSQEAVAHSADVTLRHYQRIESGTENPRADTLIKISGALEVPVSFLLGESNSPGSGSEDK
jgi:transcriptional regulator with XRE-family HTH domain